MDDFFKGLGNVSAKGGGNYFAPGVYDCEVLDLSRRVSQNPQGGRKGNRLFVAEFRVERVVASRGAEVVDGETRYPASNAGGERVSQIVNLDQLGETALSQIKALMLAVIRAKGVKVPGTDRAVHAEADLTPEQWGEITDKATTPPGPSRFAGTRVRVQITPKATPTRGGKWITIASYDVIP